MNETRIEIVFDKKCPACSKYCDMVKSSDSRGQVMLIDARDPSDLMTRITDLGLDIDEGMVVVVNEELTFGAEAIHTLALVNSRSGFFNRANSLIFGNRRVAKIIYPVLRSVRNLLLKILGVDRINNLKVHGRNKF